MPTKTELEAIAIADHLRIADKVVLARQVSCFDASENPVTVECDPPAVMRVRKAVRPAANPAILNWIDEETLAPFYDAHPMETHAALAGHLFFYVNGPVLSTGGLVHAPAFTVAGTDTQERYAIDAEAATISKWTDDELVAEIHRRKTLAASIWSIAEVAHLIAEHGGIGHLDDEELEDAALMFLDLVRDGFAEETGESGREYLDAKWADMRDGILAACAKNAA